MGDPVFGPGPVRYVQYRRGGVKCGCVEVRKDLGNGKYLARMGAVCVMHKYEQSQEKERQNA